MRKYIYDGTLLNGLKYYRDNYGEPTYVWDKHVNATHYVRFIALNFHKVMIS